MAEQNDRPNTEEKINSAYEFQVTKVNNNHSKENPKNGSTGPYMKMLSVSPVDSSPQLFPYNSCVCARCGFVFPTPEEVMAHWQHSPKCNYRSVCEECTREGVSEFKQCKHFQSIETAPRVVVLDPIYEDELPARVNLVTPRDPDFTPTAPQPSVVVLPPSSTRAEKRPRPAPRSTSDEESEKKICHLPPPPDGDPQKTLPYRIDFLLDSGVVKHARFDSTGAMPLLFEKKRPRKPRTHFTDSQVVELEKIFEDKKYLDAKEREVVACDLSLHEEQVKNWFQNRRSKWRKDKNIEGCV
eukprot:sb/3467449/